MAIRSHELEEPLEHEFDPTLVRELWAYRGRWVATTRTELLAVGDTAEDVLSSAQEFGVEAPIVFQVPAGDRTAYFF